ncbi:MAG: DUF1819 family protein [Gammaproteobacteria bacterium]|nr:DUF1819 family protein [Gammaproteobacteria bacterium]
MISDSETTASSRERRTTPRPNAAPAGAGTGHASLRPARYTASITNGALKLTESRAVANLLLQGLDAQGWHDAIQTRNVLQARSPETAKRLTRLLRARLELMAPPLWKMVADGSALLATHACLAAAVKHSRLLGDFLDQVVREQYRLFRPALGHPLWAHYIEDCRSRDPAMSAWSESTVERLRSSVFQILAQVGYLENTRTLKLQCVFIAKEVLGYLREHDEQYVLRCIQVSP